MLLQFAVLALTATNTAIPGDPHVRRSVTDVDGRAPSDELGEAIPEQMLARPWNDIRHHAADRVHRFFRPKESSSFRIIPGTHKVNVSFLDDTMFKGYDGSDFVELGQYRISTRLCFITETEGRSLWNVDGILGFGLVEFKRTPALLETMSQKERKDWGIKQPGKILDKRQFTFVATNTGAELQLGGYDSEAIEGKMSWTNHYRIPSETKGSGVEEYNVKLTSLRLGNHQLLEFGPHNESVGALLDTGTSCLTLPRTKMGVSFTTTPYSEFISATHAAGISLFGRGSTPSLFFGIDGEEFELPYMAWHTQGCVQSSEKDFILGDPFFRHYVVLFDMVKKPYRYGIGRRNKKYRIVSQSHPDVPYFLTDQHLHEYANRVPAKMAVQRHHTNVRRGILHEDFETPSLADDPEVLSRVPGTNVNNLQYTIDMSVGTPPQKMTVIFDTGSYMLAVHSKEPTNAQKDKAAAGLLSVIAASHPKPPLHQFLSSGYAVPLLASAAIAGLLVVAVASRLAARYK